MLQQVRIYAAPLAGLLLAARPAAAGAQQAAPLLPISRQFAGYSQRTLPEKLFCHLDQPVYSAGETIWLTLYAVDGTYHKPLALSQVAYAEVLDEHQRPVAQTKIRLQQASGQGTIGLPAGLATGRYTVRAYTSWMKNAGPDFFFHTTITVLNTAGSAGTAPAAGAPAYDLQFFPEGGSLVQGLPSKVGFRVVDHTGHGVAATGTVRGEQGTVAATFQTLKFGLGSFGFTPLAAGGTYTATVRLPGGATLTGKLPRALAQGNVLSLSEASPGQLRLQLRTNAPAEAEASFFLLVHSGQRMAVARTAQASKGQVSFVVDKSDLLAGISHFTVFNRQRQPVGERLYFRRPQQLALQAVLAHPSCSQRARASLRLAVAGSRQPASLSVAVYRLDSLANPAQQADITSFLHLTADLKGTVENPAYYCQDTSQTARLAADNLMLTHGWSRFRWAEVLSGQPPVAEYLPETAGHIVQGQVVRRASHAPVAGVATYLSVPGRAFRLAPATSKPSGLVRFELRDFYGPQLLVAQTASLADSLHQVQLLSPFSTRYPAPPPPLALAERQAPVLALRHLQAQVQQIYGAGNQQPARFPAVDSTVFYGEPTERYLLDDFTRFKVLEEVMREYVPGVRVRQRRDGLHFVVADKPRQALFENDPLVLLDGVPVGTQQMLAFDPLKIRRLDVVTSRYLLGSQLHEGVVSFTTYRGDLAGFALEPHALLVEYEGLQGQRDFFAPRYETSEQQHSRLPDLRNLLYWNPRVALAPGTSAQLDFYTSDQPGRYAVVVQGLAADGLSGSATTVLEVTPTL